MTTLTQINPATGDVLGDLPEWTSEQIRDAAERARAAFPAWRDTPLAERLHCIRQMRQYLVDQADALAREIAQYTGKVPIEALTHEILLVIDSLHYYEQHAPAILSTKKTKTPILLFGNHSYIEYKPMGVVAVIAPWNFPFLLSVVPAISALIAGNTVLLKPSEAAPFMGKMFEAVFRASGFPDGVVQVVHGRGNVGAELIAAHPDKIFFTGSVATGKKIMSAAAENLIPCELELGGKDPMIVFADCNLDRAARAAVWGAFTNAGQVCLSVERVYVEESIYEPFMRKVRELTSALRLGVDYGSMTFPPQLAIVDAHLQDALEKGAQVECGGRPLREGTLYYAPTIVTGVDHSMRLMQEETFGPVMPVMTFRTEQEVIRLANDTEYGLNASVWSQDLGKAKRVASALISGNVCINEVISSIGNMHLPFGGVKHSGMGAYHAEVGLRTFSHQTSVMVSKGTKPREINWYPYTQDLYGSLHAIIRLLYAPSKRWVGWPALRNLLRQVLDTYRYKGETSPPPQDVQKNNHSL
ncbi:MAG: aldehyde dehydrogenase family protein [Tumebacillaceae bacterium]